MNRVQTLDEFINENLNEKKYAPAPTEEEAKLIATELNAYGAYIEDHAYYQKPGKSFRITFKDKWGFQEACKRLQDRKIDFAKGRMSKSDPWSVAIPLSESLN